ncbi:hypothetical protein RUM44_001834 [Polyplax serrata]|uniref:WASH complex subunit 3 n=1 Tax=Polyplax serrata TaxID=468196 RepID=A0ABR1ALW2_POLSC
MNVEELSMIGPNVDLETVNAINKKRLLAFVNHFIVNTTQFLNNLSKSCEYGLMTLENKIQKLETSIVMLESKLNSVPGLGDDGPVRSKPVESVKVEENESKEEKVEEAPIGDNEVQLEINSESESGKTKEKEPLDPAYMKYVKMLQFGVPGPAVKLKLVQENVPDSLHELILNYNK